ncbi:MAG: CDP-alcohol phosphatidyltransferase family protein [Wenzhouxiangellaceae bacterium]
MIGARHLPNLLTIARIAAVIPLVWLLLDGQYRAGLVVAVLVGFTDWLDGALARRYGWESELGGVLDPVADKLLVLSMYGTLAWLGTMPWWLVVMTLTRDAVIVTGGLVYHLRFERFQAAPTRLSKFNTFCQLLLGWVLLLTLAGVPVPPVAVQALIHVVAVLIVVTALQYVWIWGRRAARLKRHRRGARETPP